MRRRPRWGVPVPLHGTRWLRWVDVGLAVAAGIAAVSVALRVEAAEPWGWTVPGALAVAVVMAFPIAIVTGRREHRMLLETPVLLPLAILLPPATAVVATVLGAFAGTAARLHRAGQQEVWAASLRTAATFGISVAVLTAVDVGDSADPLSLAVTMLALVGLHLAVVLPPPLLRGRANPDALGVSVWRQLQMPLLVTPLAAASAAVVVLLVQTHGPAGLMAYAPIALVMAGGSRLTSAQRDRRRLDALYVLAVDTAEVASEQEAVAAAVRVLQRAVPGAVVRRVPHEPGPGQLGVRLHDGQWLLLTRRTDGFTPEDADLVSAVGRLTATAVERAEAVGGLRRRERVQSALLAAAGHDLQTPLAVQQGLAETVRQHRDELPEEQVDRMLERIHASALRMSRTIRGLVDLERLELGAAEGRADAAAAVTDWWHEVHRRDGHAVVLELDERPTPVRLGAAFLERVVDNLVANAVRHSPPDEPVVVRVVREADGVLLAVDDRGPGVPQTDRDRIFRALDQGSDGVRGSVGLGLFIVLRLVEHGGGRVEVTDRAGGGASFRVRLPFPGAPLAAPEAAVTAPPVGVSPAAGRRHPASR